MENYRPCILWNDINFPDFHKKERLYEVFAHFYSKICPGHGIINDRWKLDGFNGDFKTPEYRTLEQVSWSEPWESNRGVGYSFGYNRNEGTALKIDCSGTHNTASPSIFSSVQTCIPFDRDKVM